MEPDLFPALNDTDSIEQYKKRVNELSWVVSELFKDKKVGEQETWKHHPWVPGYWVDKYKITRSQKEYENHRRQLQNCDKTAQNVPKDLKK